MNINTNAKIFTKKQKNSICFSFTSQTETAITNSGNLTQLIPFINDISTKDDKIEEITAVNKKSPAHFTQNIFNQSQEDLIIDLKKKEIPMNVIQISAMDLLSIIINGIKIQIKIRDFSNIGLVLKTL